MKLNQAIYDQIGKAAAKTLYHPGQEHDACGVGFVANVRGERSHEILKIAINSVSNLTHRGALDADAKTGDGAGVLTQIPHKFFKRIVEKLGHKVYQDSDLGVGMMFLPKANHYDAARCRQITEEVLAKRGLFLFGWRTVPVNMSVLGDKALLTCPQIEQVFVGRPAGLKIDDESYERLLFLVRNEIEDRAAADNIQNFYITSFSSRTVVYKGMLAGNQLERFFLDLKEPTYETALAIFHQRYSTNTFPTWPLAQPFRLLAHNGEINTIKGNRNWVAARENELQADFWGDDIKHLRPIIQDGGSDSASLDNAAEVLAISGRGISHAMQMLVPPAWENEKNMSPEVKDFYHFHSCLNEPWDGPAALVFSDGLRVGACLDRNGLRPARYKLRADGLFILASEAGTSQVPDKNTIEKGRLAPGQMLIIDTVKGKLFRDDEIKNTAAAKQPYGKWIRQHLKKMTVDTTSPSADNLDPLARTQQQLAFSINTEELTMVLGVMAKSGEEPIGSMGDDTPLAVLSTRQRLMPWYFKQLFAQVTNPPIDPIREKNVMSLTTFIGRRKNWLSESPEHAQLLECRSPVIYNEELEFLSRLDDGEFRAATFRTLFPAEEGKNALATAVRELCRQVEMAVDQGKTIIILSDRGVDEHNAPISMLLACSSVHHHLVRTGKRMRCSIVCESGEARDVHQIACLIGYGASCVNPWLALESINELIQKQQIKDITFDKAAANYFKGLEKGLLKILSKMGISTISSYRGAQIFEAIGIGKELIDECFTGTSSQIGGIGFQDVETDILVRHKFAFTPESALFDAGFYRNRKGGELHAVTAPVLQNFHTFVGLKGDEKANNIEDYKNYVESVLASTPLAIRHLLEFVDTVPIPIDEVESVESIRRRFTTAGMSLGALSPEAHEALAIAMNRIGGKSNSGEGGEDPIRFQTMENGDSANSAIKQVASGRFGVTAEYLASAKEIEIKMAQGSKPGEGGQLPGHKVTPLIAKLRRSVPGVMLISPPPHHDIYSIEDLAQLIYDLKQINPRAKVCVKLVSESGVGTIAAGVAKAHADIVLVSGHEGGTGASPLSSVKHAGSAWEIGVAETQQVLMLNGLRDRVTLRTDGGMRTGFDIVIAAILGAEEYNFGTAALIAMGCVYVRQCHINTCPVGIATQDDRLRGKFKGRPEMVVNYFNAVAQEVREFMAKLGVRTVDELIGRTDLVRQRRTGNARVDSIDLSRLLSIHKLESDIPRFHTWERNDRHEDRPLDDVILQDAKSTLRTGRKLTLRYDVKNIHRCVGTKLSGEIAYRYGDTGLSDGTLTIELNGTAGQSLGAFLVQGVNIKLTGEANDYVGKCMSGGQIALVPSASAKFVPTENIICGNTVLYGASGGRLFVNGRAGERFAVRNSGSTAVIEGIGDHGCEYMTGGTVVVLGPTGKNFGAGMSGGTAFVLDEASQFENLYNPEMVKLHRLTEEDTVLLKQLIYTHIEATESARAKAILKDWAKYQHLFWKVSPEPPKALIAEAKNADATAGVPQTKI